MNNVTLIGRLTRDPELRFVAGSGTAVTKFTLAVDRKLSKEKKREMEQMNKPTADFIRVVVWGKSAEISANYLSKGSLVAVNGSIETGSYQGKDGKTVYTTDIRANAYGGVEILEWNSSNSSNEPKKQSKKDEFGMSASEFEDDFKELEDDNIPF
jgi:single-strand DNA-binding protein